ncbi:unnamed protein product, partial [Meganyctiphanes norvegica]
MSQRTSCALDHRGCVPLKKILIGFGAPISEEQAWALCYTCIQCYQDISVEDRSKCVLVTDLNHIVLNKDGFVHSTTYLPENMEGRNRIRGSTEGKVVAELGVVLYRALDFSLNNDEERDLSPSLNHLIDLMTSAECERGETDDEGIERDSGDSEDELDRHSSFGLHDAMDLCMARITKSGETGSGDLTVQEHYRAVVRAIVAEAVDLSFFLQNVATSKRFLTHNSDLLSTEGELQHLQCEDWARLWMQVMRQLRDGVRLKKAHYTLQPLEYSLTPYEMLMEDIRSKRYSLNKVMENGDIPQKVKKDAHSIILDFIRSRPPLKKASERKLLPPPRKVSSPMELLMESIRKDQKLRHVQTPVRSRPISLIETSRPNMVLNEEDKPRRKLIQAPRFNISNESEDDDDLSDIPPSSPRQSHMPKIPDSSKVFNSSRNTSNTITNTPLSRQSTLSRDSTPTDINSLQSPQPDSPPTSPWGRLTFDLANYGKSATPERRHSITLCETPQPRSNSVSIAFSPPSSGCNSNATSAPSSPAHGDIFASTSQTQRDFLSSQHFSNRLDCLALTLKEVVHIRNVLTKADLEALPLDLTIKEDMAKGKVCFLCMKVRFSFFGPRGHDCRLCKRTVCKKCISKMRIPMEHFDNIPIQMLTPQALSPRDEDEDFTLGRSILSRLTSSVSKTIAKHMQVTDEGLDQELDPDESQEITENETQTQQSTESLGSNETLENIDDELEVQELPYGSSGPGSGPSSDCGNRRSSINSVGSAPSSPILTRSSADGPTSLPAHHQPPVPYVSEAIKKKQKARSRSTREDRLRGELMNVCGDCKAMVLHILASIRLRREAEKNSSAGTHESPRHHLHLNLQPVYH